MTTENPQDHSKIFHPPEEFDANPPISDIFKDIESKIDQLSDFKIASLVEVVQLNLKNNHQRLLALESVSPNSCVDLHLQKLEIQKENHFLAGKILPKLYARIQG